MANPTYPVELTAGQWNLIASGVTRGLVHMKSGSKFWQTYRLTDDDVTPAPTLKPEGVEVRQYREGEEIINSRHPIDVYIWTDVPATLRVDL